VLKLARDQAETKPDATSRSGRKKALLATLVGFPTSIEAGEDQALERENTLMAIGAYNIYR